MLSRGNALKRIGSGLVPKDGIKAPTPAFSGRVGIPSIFLRITHNKISLISEDSREYDGEKS